MPRGYSEDLRRRVVADTDKGLSLRAVAETYSVSLLFVSKVTRVWRHEGAVACRQVGGYKRHVLVEPADAIRHQLAEQNGRTLVALRDWAQAARDVRVHLSSVDRFVRSRGYRYKTTAAGLRTRPR